MPTLRSISDKLRLLVRDEASIRMINSRVILRTGVSLLQPTPAQEEDSTIVAKVGAALRDMGFDV